MPFAAIRIAGNPLQIADLDLLRNPDSRIEIQFPPELPERLNESVESIRRAVDSETPIYGVTTGFGGMSGCPVSSEFASQSQHNLLAFLSAGCGTPISSRHVRSAMLLRANVLARGYSGIRFEWLERLKVLLENNATPIVREFGSIGASGDLIPLSTIARALLGSSDNVQIRVGERQLSGTELARKFDFEPLTLQPKEGLALVNGTSFSTAIAANAWLETKRLSVLALAVQGIFLRSLNARTNPFKAFTHQLKPHPGQVWVASWMSQLLASDPDSTALRNGTPQNGMPQNGQQHHSNGAPHRPGAGPSLSNGSKASNGHHASAAPESAFFEGREIQDRYAIRCLPQYLGPLFESLGQMKSTLEIEMHAVSDNPIVDPDRNEFFQSGNFLGQHVALAMDDLRRVIGLIGKHLDVQIAQLAAPEFNRGLAPSLRGNQHQSYNMGLKGLQISGNSLLPMLLHLSNPIVSHFPTYAEQFNQNVNGLSWGAANLAWQSVSTFQYYLSVSLIFAIQAIDLRAAQSAGDFDGRRLLTEPLCELYETIYEVLGETPDAARPFIWNDDDRWLEADLQKLQVSLANENTLFTPLASLLSSFDELCDRWGSDSVARETPVSGSLDE